MSHKINHANIKDWAKNYQGPLFDGILCDPPYELGFMGKSWDSSGIAFDTEMWADIYKLLKPGAHLLAFSGSRTYHRMAVAIEDAGFEIRDMIEWVYGSGFPKSLNIGKAVDKIQGNEREEYVHKYAARRVNTINTNAGHSYGFDTTKKTDTKGTSEWEGYGTALKPAHEPCVLARKPIEGTVSQNVLKHGTGGLAIDKCRVEHNVEPIYTKRTAPKSSGEKMGMFKENGNMATPNPTGRFPANLILSDDPEVEAVFPQTKGISKKGSNNGTAKSMFGNKNMDTGNMGFGDSGSASRFFYCAKASKSERNAGLEGFEDRIAGGMQGRADGSLAGPIVYNKNVHPTVKPLSLTKYLATLIKPPTGGRLLVPFSGSGSEMIGALQAGWEYVEGVELTEEYIPIAEARIKYWTSLPNMTLSKPKSARKAEPVQSELINLTLI